MPQSLTHYFQGLCEALGTAWNRFWYTPADPLPLGVMRLGAAAMALYVVLTYFPSDLQRFFTEDGLLPLETIGQYRGGAPVFSYFAYLSAPRDLLAAHWIGVGVLVAYLLGIWSRITAVLAVAVVVSYFHRAPMLVGQLETLLAMVMVYLCLGPSGAYLSLDRWLRLRRRAENAAQRLPERDTPSYSANIALRLIQLHLCLIYLMMGLSKLQGDAWWTGMSVWWLAARFETCPFDLLWLRDHPFLANAWAHVIVAFELVFPILIWNRWARPLLLAVAPVVFLLEAIPTGLFAWAVMMVIANFCFIPAPALHAWLRLRRRRSAGRQPREATAG